MEPQTLTWTAHPLRTEPGLKSGALILTIFGLSALFGYSFDGAGYGLLSAGLLTAAMSRYFFSTRYVLDDVGVTISHLGFCRSRPWAQFRRAARHPDGVFLSPFDRPHRLDTFRGQFLRADHRVDEVLHVVRQHIPHDAP